MHPISRQYQQPRLKIYVHWKQCVPPASKQHTGSDRQLANPGRGSKSSFRLGKLPIDVCLHGTIPSHQLNPNFPTLREDDSWLHEHIGHIREHQGSFSFILGLLIEPGHLKTFRAPGHTDTRANIRPARFARHDCVWVSIPHAVRNTRWSSRVETQVDQETPKLSFDARLESPTACYLLYSSTNIETNYEVRRSDMREYRREKGGWLPKRCMIGHPQSNAHQPVDWSGVKPGHGSNPNRNSKTNTKAINFAASSIYFRTVACQGDHLVVTLTLAGPRPACEGAHVPAEVHPKYPCTHLHHNFSRVASALGCRVQLKMTATEYYRHHLVGNLNAKFPWPHSLPEIL
ncbi:uncharacterized protein CLUP02_14992 [Colletotrichum lupini]|uniref:Uncharacterized protein n=1 Tax=Colletotrichum lupini TaxID=145971 RepID=A0A9Q8T591_9PEZI|nr:uncharacterized protein CLUP02_14992 [Colletotrichum lupini]UQC89461.1 hypothetical protein CLUP02_14992 [Colletotrichum lupini]